MRLSFVFALFSALLMSAANTCAQTAELPERFGHWIAAEPAETFTPDTLYGPLLNEAGIKATVSRIYSNGLHKSRISLLQLKDPSSAFSVLTLFGSAKNSSPIPGRDPSVVGQRLSLDVYGLAAVIDQVGNLIVQVESAKAKDFDTADWNALKDALGKRADRAPLPPVREFLPKEELENGTQRYALGPVAFRTAAEALGRPELGELADTVGFAAGAEAMLGRYKAGALVILIDYPTPQLAELHMRHLDTSMPEAAKRAGATIERKGSLLSLVMAPAMPGYAQKLRDAVNYETQVTWNEPSATATDPPWAIVLYRIFIGTGIFMGAAIVMGVAFGGVRVFVKRLLPGKVFDRPETMEVLQLGLSGKRIDPSDFY